jgi:hypothetical protein
MPSGRLHRLQYALVRLLLVKFGVRWAHQALFTKRRMDQLAVVLARPSLGAANLTARQSYDVSASTQCRCRRKEVVRAAPIDATNQIDGAVGSAELLRKLAIIVRRGRHVSQGYACASLSRLVSG